MAKHTVTRRGFLGKGALGAGAIALAGCDPNGEQTAPPRPLKVRYGLNMLVYTPTFSKDRLDLIQKTADMGYDGVEIPFNDLSVLDAKATDAAREKAGVGLTSCCVMMPGTNLCSDDPAERAAGVERIKKLVDITAEMGGDVVAGPIYSPVSYLSGTGRTDEEWTRCVDGLGAAAQHAEKANITLAVEPLNRFETYVFNTVGDAAKLCEAIGSPALTVQADTFHCHIEEDDTAAAIRACGKRLGHFHASESQRGTPGTGQVRWQEVFAALKDIQYDRWVTIESFAIGIRDLCKAACIWRPIYTSADDLAKNGLAFLKKMAAEA
ncbi:sugar phosphate isomerase/epimerase [bacterium]|nr:sugar phosphate isomerase/epimerase [bacterium]